MSSHPQTGPIAEVSRWRPLLDGALARRALDRARRIGDALRSAPLEPPDLAGGAAGLAIAFTALEEAFPGAGFGDEADRRLAAALEAVETMTLDPSFYGGFTGIAWTLDLLQAGPTESVTAGEPETDDASSEIDDAILTWLNRRPWRDHHDLVAGLVGVGVYALEREARGQACVSLIIDHLRALARATDAGITWDTPAALLNHDERARNPGGCTNLGLAHGVPGIICFLASACAAGEARARALLRPAVAWLRAQELAEGGYPTRIVPGRASASARARLAWCYGDAGVSSALWQAGLAGGEPDWCDAALALARRAATRPLEQTGVVDAGLCHGSAGLAHIYNRLWQASGDEALRQASERWIASALDQARPGEGAGGYRFWRGTGWEEAPGLLDGAAGVALALLAAATPIEPCWDRMLLLSGLPRRLAVDARAARVRVERSGAPQAVGGYRITERIGGGGMGAVFRASHPDSGESVALKIVHRQLADKPEVVARFLDEVRAARQIRNRHIVEVLDVGQTDDGEHFFTMEYLAGPSLYDELASSGGTFPADRALHIGAQIADGLAAAHAQGILHRDVKPDNVVLIEERGERDFVKLLDFGLARFLAEPETHAVPAGGLAPGTPGYLAPEVCENRPAIDHRSDIYSLGVVLFEMVTGLVPFAGGHREILAAQVADAPPPPRWINPEVPPAVEAVILRCLAKDPAARFQSMDELRDALLWAASR